MAEMNFTCGHSANIPVNAGRGQARTRRLTEYFGRKCLTCKIAGYADFTKTLNTFDSSGKVRPLTEEEIVQHVLEKIPEFTLRYKYIGK